MSAPEPSVPPGTLLLGIDLQPVFVAAVADGAAVANRCALALAAATGLGLPVAFTEQVPEKLGATDPAIRGRAPAATVWAKNTFSALADPAIRTALVDERSVEHLLLCGVETPICIYQTAIDALAAGLQVTVLSDAVGARRSADARVALEALARHGAHVLPVETVFYALLGTTAHPFFRAFTRLVKEHSTPSPHA